MYLQEILEVAVGLVFMWLVVSLAVSAVQEWIASIWKWRANDLEKSIRHMLGNSDELKNRLYENPLIANLFQPAKKDGQKPRLPSYIPANKFASALFDVVMYAGRDQSPINNLTKQIEAQLRTIDDRRKQKIAREDWLTILQTAKQVASSHVGEAAVNGLMEKLEAYGKDHAELKSVIDQARPQVVAAYQKFLDEQRVIANKGLDTKLLMSQFQLGMVAVGKTNAKLYDSIVTLLRNGEAYVLQGEQAIAKARTSFENWFDDAMLRLSGAYKRRAQWVAFFIGLGLALILNVDSIHVSTSLWREPTLRQAILSQAKSFTEQNPQPQTTTAAAANTPDLLPIIQGLQEQLKGLKIPFGWTTDPFDTNGRKCSWVPFIPTKAWGISSQDDQGKPVCKHISNLPVDLGGWASKLLGLAITALAATQGAPFWYDLLMKLVNVRGSGINPDSKKEKEAFG